VQCASDEFAAESRNLVVEEFEEERAFTELQELADGTDTLILTVGLPETDR